MEYTKKTHFCYHCGNEGIMIKCGSYTNNSDGDYFYHEENELLKCPVCCKPLIFNTFISDDDFDVDDEGNKVQLERIIFPGNKLLESRSIPKEIREAYDAALRTKNRDNNIFALALRRTLELITKNQKATGRDLEKKIEFLANAKVLPEQLKDAANITRLIGNLGAHSTINGDIGEDDLDKITKFIEYIIQYIYILPEEIAKLDKVKTKK